MANWRVRVHLEELGLNGRKYYNAFQATGRGGVDWIHLAQGRDKCKALVNVVMNHCTPLDLRIFLSS